LLVQITLRDLDYQTVYSHPKQKGLSETILIAFVDLKAAFN